MANEFDHAEFLEFVIRQLEGTDIEYMLAGSWASSVYGEPRQTLDVDIVINLRPEEVDSLCGLFPKSEGFYVSVDAARQAVRARHQFNVLHPASGNKVDFIVAADDAWNRGQLARRRRVFINPHLEGFSSSPEDVIIAKMLYYREGASEKHVNDIAKMLDKSGAIIDQDYITHWSTQLGLLPIWEVIKSRVQQGS